MDQEGSNSPFDTLVISKLEAAVAAGETTAAAVAMAVRRLFRVRIRLGLLDPPQVHKYTGTVTDRQSGRQRVCVREREKSVYVQKRMCVCVCAWKGGGGYARARVCVYVCVYTFISICVCVLGCVPISA
jgi:hypothetical protein